MDDSGASVFADPKEISIGSMDFDNPKVFGDTSLFDGFVEVGEAEQETLLKIK